MKTSAEKSLIFIAGFCITSLFTSVVQGKIYQKPTSITNAVTKFLEKSHKRENFNIGRIDKRLRLARCQHIPHTRFPQYAQTIGRTSIEVSCNHPKPWKILVTVNIKKYLNVITIKNGLPSGSIIQAGDIKMTRKDVSQIRGGYFTNLSQVSNMVLRRTMRSGQILSASQLKPRQLVTRGDEVLILAETGNLTIRVKGKALMNGTLGQRIKVKNSNSSRIFQATVISNGLVKVNM